MRKNKFIKSTLILFVAGIITKCLGMFIKVYYTRLIGDQGVSILSMTSPTYSLFLTFAVLNLPLSLSSVIAKYKNGKKTVLSVTPFIIIFDIIFILLVFLLAPFLAEKLLHNKLLLYPIISMALTIPFVSLSSIVKGYFFGNQNMLPYAFSNVGEQIIRLIIISLFIPKLLKLSLIHSICGFFLINIFSELFSVLIFTFFMPRNITISIDNLKPDISIVKDVFGIAIPSVSARIIGNISYFFEPIIITNLLLMLGYSSTFIYQEYGIINGYVFSTLLFPTFITSSLATSLTPEISKLYHEKKYSQIKKILKTSVFLLLLIGVSVNLVIFIFPKFFLKLIFNTTLGVKYIKILAIFFPLYYIETPLASAIQAMNGAKHTFKVTTIGCIIKLLSLVIFSLFKIGLYGLILAEIINIIFVVLSSYNYIKKKIYF